MKPNKFLKGRSGIYGIRNIINAKIYVGQTTCMYRRCHQYEYDFNNRNIGHLNDYLYRAIKKVGIENFDFFPLEFCDVQHLTSRELYWINRLQSLDRKHGYNLRTDTQSGMGISQATRDLISKNLKRQWAQGVRSGHSKKLKKIWANDPIRRQQQGETFSKLKTKYEYEIHNKDGSVVGVLYADLKSMGFANVISTFHRTGKDDVIYKGIRIIRFAKGEAS